MLECYEVRHAKNNTNVFKFKHVLVFCDFFFFYIIKTCLFGE